MPDISLECVRPIESHARLIMQWRNDPDTLAMSFHTQPKQWESFYPEFINSYFAFPDLPPLFIWYEGQRVAFLRFTPVPDPVDRTRRCCDISINVAPQWRRKGIGQYILSEAKSWVAQQGYDDLYAMVKKENAISIKAFLHAGYTQLDDFLYTVPDTDEQIPICRFLAPLTPAHSGAVFIIAEAGSNWHVGDAKSDMAMAKKMIEIAAAAGVDAVKFQVFRPETIYVPNAGASDYLAEGGLVKDIREIFEDIVLPYDMIPELAAHCQKSGVHFMASAFSKQDFEAIDPYVSIHKLASYEIAHLRLVELLAHSKKPIFMSTGAALEHEINWTLETIKALHGGPVTLLQCTAKYTAPPPSMHLNTIPWLKNRFKVPVGLSDHSRDPICAPVAAVALGARVIEKHFTLDNTLQGPDHFFAVNPDELRQMVAAIRQVEPMLGSPVKIIDPCEEELFYFCKRGVQAIKDITAGEPLREGFNIDILRPGKQVRGVHPKLLDEMEGKPAKRAIKLGTGIQKGDW